jgi:hypothetical protein
MPNPQNLKPCNKGETNNPNGRPKGVRNRSTIVRYWLEAIKEAKNPITGQLEQLPIQDQIVLALIGKALKGDVAAFKELMDSGHGKITEKIESTQTIIQTEIALPPEELEDE